MSPEAAPHAEDAHDERQASAATLRAFVYGTLSITLVWALVSSLNTPGEALRAFTQWAALAAVSACTLALVRVGRVAAASWLLVSVLWLVIAASLLTRDGVYGPAYTAFSVVIVLSGVVLGARASALVALASMALGAVCVVLHARGVLPVSALGAPAARWLSTCLVFATVAVLQHLSMRFARQSLSRARAENERRRVADRARTEAVAELERVNAELAASEQRYRGMFEAAGVALFELDMSRLGELRRRFEAEHPGADLAAALAADPALVDALARELHVRDANEQAVRLLEAPGKSALIGNYLDLFQPDNRRAVVALGVALELGAAQVQQELPLRTASGRVRRVLVSARRPASPAPLARLVTSAVDVTDQRLLEERTRAAQRMETIGRFAGGVAHDFNNALAVILSWVDLLRRPALDAAVREQGLSAIRTSATRAAELTRQLMSIGRRDVRAPRPTRLSSAVDEAMGTLGRLLPSDVRVSVAHESDAWVLVDDAQLHQVLLNLVVNARDAMPQGGELELRTRAARPQDVSDLPADHGYVELSVRDTGAGMDAATRERVFEPFFTTKGEGLGTGLGLATVHAIVSAAQGKVSVDSEPGRGATFRVYLPVTQERSAVSSAPAPAAEAARGKRVLLVEDDAPVRSVMAHVLREAGYEVIAAGDGAAALALARAHPAPIDVLCTDGILPGLPTGTLIAGLRELSPGARVLVCSGHLQEELVRRHIAEGQYAFLQKPFTADALVQAVSTLSP